MRKTHSLDKSTQCRAVVCGNDGMTRFSHSHCADYQIRTHAKQCVSESAMTKFASRHVVVCTLTARTAYVICSDCDREMWTCDLISGRFNDAGVKHAPHAIPLCKISDIIRACVCVFNSAIAVAAVTTGAQDISPQVQLLPQCARLAFLACYYHTLRRNMR